MLGMGGYEDYQAVARAAEAAGFASVSMPDSIFFPQKTESDYPYADTAAVRQFISVSPFIEPIVAMTWMAAVTTKLRFYPGVMKVPVRQPLILAKALSSLAALSNNRVSLGAGLSPWREDFSYNGVDFDKRGKLMDECIEILRGAMSGEYFEYHSDNYEFGPMKMSPAVTKPRAARLGDGWISANADFDTLKGLIEQLNALRAEHGTLQRDDFEIHGFDINARTIDDMRRVRDLGVTDMCVSAWNVYEPNISLQEKLDGIRQFGDEFISKFD
jgi:alkanesulfonate monooxygenase SsuD/methylene tetrahydromethanopterin reductase-like flavin-dependent oxidoreductase (luciferase family)